MELTSSFRQIIGIPPSTASPSDSVLVIIDAQNEYATGLLETVNVGSTRAAIKALLERYRTAEGEVVHVCHKTPEEAPVFTPGKEVGKEFDELKPMEKEKVGGRQVV